MYSDVKRPRYQINTVALCHENSIFSAISYLSSPGLRCGCGKSVELVKERKCQNGKILVFNNRWNNNETFFLALPKTLFRSIFLKKKLNHVTYLLKNHLQTSVGVRIIGYGQYSDYSP